MGIRVIHSGNSYFGSITSNIGKDYDVFVLEIMGLGMKITKPDLFALILEAHRQGIDIVHPFIDR